VACSHTVSVNSLARRPPQDICYRSSVIRQSPRLSTHLITVQCASRSRLITACGSLFVPNCSSADQPRHGTPRYRLAAAPTRLPGGVRSYSQVSPSLGLPLRRGTATTSCHVSFYAFLARSSPGPCTTFTAPFWCPCPWDRRALLGAHGPCLHAGLRPGRFSPLPRARSVLSDVNDRPATPRSHARIPVRARAENGSALPRHRHLWTLAASQVLKLNEPVYFELQGLFLGTGPLLLSRRPWTARQHPAVLRPQTAVLFLSAEVLARQVSVSPCDSEYVCVHQHPSRANPTERHMSYGALTRSAAVSLTSSGPAASTQPIEYDMCRVQPLRVCLVTI
jgi:hypothetical protein